MRWRVLPALTLLLALSFAGCGGGGGSSGSAQGAPAQSGASGARSAQGSPIPARTSSRRKAPSHDEHEGGEESIERFGSEAKGPEREAILSTFAGYLEALAGKDSPTACADLAQDVRESLAQLAGKGSMADCATLLPALLSTSAPQIARQQAEGKVTRVRIKGDRGFVVFHAPGAKLFQQTMLREGARWKMATAIAAVLVPEL